MDARYCEVMRAALIKDVRPEAGRKASDHLVRRESDRGGGTGKKPLGAHWRVFPSLKVTTLAASSSKLPTGPLIALR